MIRLYIPEYNDLWFRRELLADPATMSYNHAWGGTIPFPETAWRAWYECWVSGGDASRLYRYVTGENGTFVGEIAYHFDPELNGFVANVIIHARYRGQGCGGQALDALCALAKAAGINALWDDIAIDNPAINMFLRRGFTEIRRTDDRIFLKKSL